MPPKWRKIAILLTFLTKQLKILQRCHPIQDFSTQTLFARFYISGWTWLDLVQYSCMARNSCKWQEMDGMAVNGWKGQESAKYCWNDRNWMEIAWLEWPDIAGNSLKQLEKLKLLDISGTCCKFLEIARKDWNGWKWLK